MILGDLCQGWVALHSDPESNKEKTRKHHVPLSFWIKKKADRSRLA